jgi:hypothetical protein
VGRTHGGATGTWCEPGAGERTPADAIVGVCDQSEESKSEVNPAAAPGGRNKSRPTRCGGGGHPLECSGHLMQDVSREDGASD